MREIFVDITPSELLKIVKEFDGAKNDFEETSSTTSCKDADRGAIAYRAVSEQNDEKIVLRWKAEFLDGKITNF